MTKQDLLFEVSRRTGLSLRAADIALSSALETITEKLSRGETVVLSGFGTFSTQHRAARVGRNPHTKQPVPIPACIKPKFKAGKDLLAAVESLKGVDKK